MIDINLLPPERRPVERTPFPRLATIFLGVAIVSAEVFFSLILFAFTIPGIKEDLGNKKQTLKGKQEEAKRADELEKEIKEINARFKVIEDLQQQRVVWTPVLDHLYDTRVLPEEVWLDEFEVSSATDKPGKGKISGFARGSAAYETVGKFIANMQNDETIKAAFSKIEFRGMDEAKLKSGSKKDGGMAGGRELPAVASSFEIELETSPVVKPAPEKKKKK